MFDAVALGIAAVRLAEQSPQIKGRWDILVASEEYSGENRQAAGWGFYLNSQRF